MERKKVKRESIYVKNQRCLFLRESHHHHHHHIALVARISLTLSRHSSLSFIALGRSSGQHPVSSNSCWMYVRAGRPAFARPCVGVHKSTSLRHADTRRYFGLFNGFNCGSGLQNKVVVLSWMRLLQNSYINKI